MSKIKLDYLDPRISVLEHPVEELSRVPADAPPPAAPPEPEGLWAGLKRDLADDWRSGKARDVMERLAAGAGMFPMAAAGQRAAGQVPAARPAPAPVAQPAPVSAPSRVLPTDPALLAKANAMQRHYLNNAAAAYRSNRNTQLDIPALDAEPVTQPDRSAAVTPLERPAAGATLDTMRRTTLPASDLDPAPRLSFSELRKLLGGE